MKTLAVLLILTGIFSCKPQESIIFTSGRDGNSNLFLMDRNGENLVRLTDSELEEWSPSPNPGNNAISFLRQYGAIIERHSIDPRTKKETIQSQPEACILDDKNIIYSPLSGKELYICKGIIYMNGKPVSIGLSQPFSSAVWFPDEQSIAFVSAEKGSKDIYRFDLTSKTLEQLTNHPGNEDKPDISPDGKNLLFTSDRAGNNNQDLYIKNLETGEVRNITNTPDWELIGRWSLDGKRIYFGSNKDGNWELYRFDLKDASTRRLTDSPEFDGDPRPFLSKRKQ